MFQIVFIPPLSDVAEVITDVLFKITEDLKDLPRVLDKFHGADVDTKSLYFVIAEDFECQKLQRLLEDGSSAIF